MYDFDSKWSGVLEILTEEIASAIGNIPDSERCHIQEIRLRRERFLSVKLFSKEYFVTAGGRLTASCDSALKISGQTVDTVFQRAFGNSLHSHKRELTQGYITVKGGSRVGFCGTAALNSHEDYRVENIRDISSVNIRIAREISGCAEDLYKKAFGDGLRSLLVAGPPSSGKTTVLRDLARILGQTVSVSLIDERCEFAAVSEGTPRNNIGAMTDVFSSYNKHEGVITAVRVMSPDVIVCDEIGTKEDYEALEYAINSGVKIIASCHGGALSELKKKSVISKLLKEKVFACCAILGTGPLCGKVVSFSLTGD